MVPKPPRQPPQQPVLLECVAAAKPVELSKPLLRHNARSMPEQQPDTMANFWNARAREDALFFIDNRREYGDGELDSFWRSGVSDVDKILSMLDAPAIEPDAVALDIGCGVGRLTRVLAARAREAYGIDVSSEMIDQAQALNREITNIHWIIGDGTGLNGVQDDQIDVCLSHVVFQHIPDPKITLGYVTEIGRVLKPGGWAAFQVSNDPRIHIRRPASLREKLAARRGKAPQGQSDPEWLGSAVDLQQLHAAAFKGGLELERIEGAGTQYCMVFARKS